LASKARVLVTNIITFVKQFDSMIYLRRGIVLESGSYQELIANEESEISKLM
jgi:ABC-type transport system involved in cytochrome bd biosynthesis fused ATPase/permease subunit